MKCLVVGGLGYIGSWLARRLLSEGHDVTIVDDASTHEFKNYDKARAGLDRRAKVIIDRAQNIGPDVLKGTDVLFHLAGVTGVPECENDLSKATKENIQLTKQLMEAAKTARVKTFMFTSSAAVYGDVSKCYENGEATPNNVYGDTKLKAENHIRDEMGIKVIIVRPSNIYGYGYFTRDNAPAILTRQALKNDDLTIHGDGEQTRDLIHLNDFIEALLFLLDKPGGIYNVGSGGTISINKLSLMIKKETRSKSELKHVMSDRKEVSDYFYSTKKIKDLGWKLKNNLIKGLRQLIEGVLNDK